MVQAVVEMMVNSGDDLKKATHLNSFARNSLSTAIPAGGQGEGERVEGVVGEGDDGEDDDVDVVDEDGEAGGREEGGVEEDWVGGIFGLE